jgi:hypothetical protein
MAWQSNMQAIDLHDIAKGRRFIAACTKNAELVILCEVDRVYDERIEATVISGNWPISFNRATSSSVGINWTTGNGMDADHYAITYTGSFPPGVQRRGYNGVIEWYKKEFLK